jgi:hypothetical protein
LASFPVLLQVRVLEGGFPGGDDRLRQPSDEAGPGDDYIPVSLTSSNSSWHKGWFYDPEFALPAYTGNSIGQSQRNWSDGPAKAEQEKILKDHWAVLRHLRGAGVTLSEVLRQYHARGVVSLRRRLLCLCEMTASQAPGWGP